MNVPNPRRKRFRFILLFLIGVVSVLACYAIRNNYKANHPTSEELQGITDYAASKGYKASYKNGVLLYERVSLAPINMLEVYKRHIDSLAYEMFIYVSCNVNHCNDLHIGIDQIVYKTYYKRSLKELAVYGLEYYYDNYLLQDFWIRYLNNK